MLNIITPFSPGTMIQARQEGQKEVSGCAKECIHLVFHISENFLRLCTQSKPTQVDSRLHEIPCLGKIFSPTIHLRLNSHEPLS
jgi:hypothetical protein